MSHECSKVSVCVLINALLSYNQRILVIYFKIETIYISESGRNCGSEGHQLLIKYVTYGESDRAYNVIDVQGHQIPNRISMALDG